MCACDERAGYTCSRHRDGSLVDADMNLREWREWTDQERCDREQAELSRPDFENPYGGGS